MSTVKVILDSTFKHGLILRGAAPVKYAYDGMGHAEALPRERSHIELHRGVNIVEQDEIEIWRTRAADAGLAITRANDVYIVTNMVAGAHDARPSAAKDSRSVIERALSSDR